jgi:hypothetical protein
MFRINVKVQNKKVPTLTVERATTTRAANAIAVPDSYLSAIENARKAEARAIHRLCMWTKLNHPTFFAENEMQAFMEDE